LTTWRIVFMGTPAFACASLEALLAGPDPVVAVVCQPDRPRGRGLEVLAPETKRLAERHHVPVLQPARLRDPAFHETLRSWAPDLGVVAAYGRILPREVLELPPHGCINVHASLLPRHRGAAPVQWSLMSGDEETGITIMRMNEELDAGDILLQRRLGIRPDHTGGTLLAELSALGGRALTEAIEGLKAGRLRARPQPAAGVTFAPRIEREHCRLHWSRNAEELERQIRALAPSPCAFTTVRGRLLKVHRARAESSARPGPPGTVSSAGPDGIVVATGGGSLRLLEVQLEGRKPLAVAAFLAGFPLPPGSCLGAP
jgi:methionyl-tRNA formyltransferase